MSSFPLDHACAELGDTQLCPTLARLASNTAKSFALVLAVRVAAARLAAAARRRSRSSPSPFPSGAGSPALGGSRRPDSFDGIAAAGQRAADRALQEDAVSALSAVTHDADAIGAAALHAAAEALTQEVRRALCDDAMMPQLPLARDSGAGVSREPASRSTSGGLVDPQSTTASVLDARVLAVFGGAAEHYMWDSWQVLGQGFPDVEEELGAMGLLAAAAGAAGAPGAAAAVEHVVERPVLDADAAAAAIILATAVRATVAADAADATDDDADDDTKRPFEPTSAFRPSDRSPTHSVMNSLDVTDRDMLHNTAEKTYQGRGNSLSCDLRTPAARGSGGRAPNTPYPQAGAGGTPSTARTQRRATLCLPFATWGATSSLRSACCTAWYATRRRGAPRRPARC